MIRLGVDTGGTFTDFVLIDKGQIITHKVLSTPREPEQAIIRGISQLGLSQQLKQGQIHIIHGTTVATNAVLEGKGAKTAFITNRGLKDLLIIARQSRPALYQLDYPPRHTDIDPHLCLETGGRLSVDGEIIDPLTEADLDTLKRQVSTLKPEAIAICLLFSYLNGDLEKKLANALPQHLPISLSHEVLAQTGEYERGIATWLNARLETIMSRYLQRLAQHLAPCTVSIMQSCGGLMHIEQATKQSVRLLLSGPAGGLIGAQRLGYYPTGSTKAPLKNDLMTFDMGGTSTDVALINRQQLPLTQEAQLGPYPIAIPMVDMHTIGAGGGSIAYIDTGGLLQVGPQSAGSDPGPACYNKGGKYPTVTDANLLVGRLHENLPLAADLKLSRNEAIKAIEPLAVQLKLSPTEVAQGILDIANEQMVQALRHISIAKGYDPKNCTLCCFGGAGGLHACDLAQRLNMSHILIPLHNGVLSAFGLALARPEQIITQSINQPLVKVTPSQLDELFQNLQDQAYQALSTDGVEMASATAQKSVDLCYQGQSFPLNVAYDSLQSISDAFHQLHQLRYGHRLNLPLELVTARLILTVESAPLKIAHWAQHTPSMTIDEESLNTNLNTPTVHKRCQLAENQTIEGPAIIWDPLATIFIAPNWHGKLDTIGNLYLTNSKR